MRKYYKLQTAITETQFNEEFEVMQAIRACKLKEGTYLVHYVEEKPVTLHIMTKIKDYENQMNLPL